MGSAVNKHMIQKRCTSQTTGLHSLVQPTGALRFFNSVYFSVDGVLSSIEGAFLSMIRAFPSMQTNFLSNGAFQCANHHRLSALVSPES
jgi:hypothetical protein